jgi:hypothetical protein
MIVGSRRLLGNLSRHHCIAVFLTVILPVIGPWLIDSFAPDYFLLRAVVYVVAFLLWSLWALWALLAVAWVVSREKSEAEQFVAPKIDSLSRRISSLEEQTEDLSVDLLREADNLEEVVRTTLSEELEVVLPPRPVSLRARATAGRPTISANLTVVGGSKLARLREWLRRKARRIWEVVYGKPDGS